MSHSETLPPAAAAGSKPKAKRIGVLMPAGRVQNHDEVVTYTYGAPDKSLGQFVNIGDLFVFESSLRLLDFAELVPISVSEKDRNNPDYIAELNKLDYIFLRGSNYINTSGNWDATVALLEKVHVPVIAFGIGVQVPETATEFVNDITGRFMAMIAERSKTLAVRGELSAQALASIGVKDVRIIGCPTAFRHRKPAIEVRKVMARDIETLGFTLRRKTFAHVTLQRYLIRTLAERFTFEIFCAGELEEKAIVYGTRLMVPDADEVRERAVAALIEEGWFYGPTDPLIRLYERNMNCFESVADFEARIVQMTAVTGFRLHGNLLALANGIPALYMIYDTRTREFAKTLGIPCVETKQMDRFAFERAWDAARFDLFEKAYQRRFREVVAFLDENGIPHRMGGSKAKPAPKAAPAPMAEPAGEAAGA